MSARQILYHITNVAPSVVLKKGLLGTRTGGFTREARWVFDYGLLPEDVVFLTTDPALYKGKYTYAVDVTGLKLLPDYAELVEHGMLVEEDEKGKLVFWWEEAEEPEELRKVLNAYGETRPHRIKAAHTLAITGTAAVSGPIHPSRIRLMEL